MFSRSIGLLACALVAQGFLIPPNLNAASSDNTHALDFVSVNTKNQVLELPCPTCAFAPKKDSESATGIDDKLWIQGGANNLVLNFTITSDGRALQLNGLTEYPWSAGGSGENARKLHVDQIAASTSREDLMAGNFHAVPLQVTSHGVDTAESIPMDAGETLIGLKWGFLELNNQPVEVDEVGVQLLKLKDGELLILSVVPIHEEVAHDPLAVVPRPKPTPPSDDCGSLPAPVCRLLHSVTSAVDAAKDSKVGKLTGCAGRKGGYPHRLPGHIRPHFNIDGRPHGPPFHHGGPHGMRPHHGPHGHHGHRHGHHHGHHAALMSFVGVFMSVLSFIFWAFAFGIAIGAITAVVDRIVVWVWIRKICKDVPPTGKYTLRILHGIGYRKEKWYPDAEVDEEAGLPEYEEAPPYELSEKEEQKAPLLGDGAQPQL